MAINTDKTAKKIVYLPKELVEKIDDFRFGHRIKSEGEAIRRLIQKGLEQDQEKA